MQIKGKEIEYEMEISEDKLYLKTSTDEGVEQSLAIPFDDLLPWVDALNTQLDQIGIKPITLAKNKHMAEQQKTHKQAYNRWTEEDDAQLREMYQAADFEIESAMEFFQRNKGSIQSRLAKLGLLNK